MPKTFYSKETHSQQQLRQHQDHYENHRQHQQQYPQSQAQQHFQQSRESKFYCSKNTTKITILEKQSTTPKQIRYNIHGKPV